MSKKNPSSEINIDIHKKITRLPIANMPARLYEHLFRTACDWALNGDQEAAQWIIDELLLRQRIAETATYESARTRKAFSDYHGMPCVVCGKPSDTVDHIIPKSRGGTNHPSNLQPMCRSCNSKKSAKI